MEADIGATRLGAGVTDGRPRLGAWSPQGSSLDSELRSPCRAGNRGVTSWDLRFRRTTWAGGEMGLEKGEGKEVSEGYPGLTASRRQENQGWGWAGSKDALEAQDREAAGMV